MYICKRITDDKLCGAQSNAPRSGAMIAQAVQDYGGGAGDYLEVHVQDGEYAALREATDNAGLTLELAKARKTAKIRAEADRAALAITAGYSVIEQASWPQQRAEAEALKLDTQAPASLLRLMAAARGIEVLDLRDKVLANVVKAEQATGLLLGQQQALVDQVKNIKLMADGGTYETETEAVAAVLAVEASINLPEG